MIRLLKNKRGLSPLIATILLIAFAVALGAVVMNIGRSTILPDSGSSIFTLLEIGGAKQICYFDKGTESLLEFTIKNKGMAEISDLQLSLVGKRDIINTDDLLKQPIKKVEVRKVMVKYDGITIGQLNKVIITPIVIEDNQPGLKNSLEFDNIPLC